MEITIIIILSLFVFLFGYVCYNLFRKVERLESVVLSQDEFIQSFSNEVNRADIKLKEIDEKGSFQSDDEVGWFFEGLKEIQSRLNNFNLKSPH